MFLSDNTAQHSILCHRQTYCLEKVNPKPSTEKECSKKQLHINVKKIELLQDVPVQHNKFYRIVTQRTKNYDTDVNEARLNVTSKCIFEIIKCKYLYG